MRDLRIPAAVVFTSSLFLVHCSSAEDPPANSSGTSGTASGSAGTPPGGAGKSGAGGGAGTGVAGTGGSMGGTSGASSGAGKGGLGGGAGQSSGGAGTTGAGAGGRSMAGGAGMSAGGMAGTGAGMGGQSGSGGGMAGMGGKAGGGVGGTSGGAMTLTSTVITEGGMFPDLNTCAGDNKSPDLTWTAGPSGTMSYAVVLLDTDNDLNHWVIWDIPSSVTTLAAGLDSMAMPATPAGAKQKSFQANAYYGPCPSGMDHVYRFTVYALPVASVTGAMTSEMTAAIVADIMAANPLGSASLSAHSNASM